MTWLSRRSETNERVGRAQIAVWNPTLVSDHVDGQPRKRTQIAEWGLIAICLVAACTLTVDEAFAETYIDVDAQPYFVIGGWIAAAFFLGIGFILLWMGLRYRRLAAASVAWPTTQGTVISSEVSKRISRIEDNTFEYFLPEVRYSYNVVGVRREGNVIRIGLAENGYLTEVKARELVARFPVGATPPVRYDPRSQEIAALEIGQIGGTPKMIAGALLTSVGAGAVIFAIWSSIAPTS